MENIGIYINILIILFLVSKFFIDKIISKEVFLLFILSSTGPILLNLTPVIYNIFPDQGGYYDNIVIFRDYYNFDILRHSDQNKFLTLILTFIPLPSVDNIISAVYLNKFLLFSLIIYLIKFNYIKNYQAIILLLYPSLFLYSSLFLKETVIIVFLTISYIYLIKEKYLFSILCIGLVFFVKANLALLFVIIYGLYIVLYYLKPNLQKVIYILILSGLLFIVLGLHSNLLEQLNLLIFNFNMEASNYSKESQLFDKNLIGINLKSFLLIFKSSISFWFKPLIYKATSLSELGQSIENILIFITLAYFLKKLYLIDIKKTYFLITALLITSLPYAIIVSNVGTLSRYRFSIIIIFMIIIFFELNQNKKNEK